MSEIYNGFAGNTGAAFVSIYLQQKKNRFNCSKFFKSYHLIREFVHSHNKHLYSKMVTQLFLWLFLLYIVFIFINLLMAKKSNYFIIYTKKINNFDNPILLQVNVNIDISHHISDSCQVFGKVVVIGTVYPYIHQV